MASMVSAGLFLIGVGIGTTIGQVLYLPEQLAFIKPALWIILIVIGVILIIKSHN